MVFQRRLILFRRCHAFTTQLWALECSSVVH
jgi:hypothetical protein